MNYKLWNNALGWLVFSIATYVYFVTAEDTVSLWDCGEYISTANGLQVGHPPGAPLFNMVGRLFSAGVSSENVAVSINYMSALCSSFSILFLFWTITYIARRMALQDGAPMTDGKIIAILGSGLIGSLVYTFSDSFWFSASEGEVYAMSAFFTAVVIWAIFKWDEVADEPGADRWIILIMFLIGLSVGVHLLNLLAIPAMGFVYYFRRYTTNTKGFMVAGIISIFILGFIQGFVIPGLVSWPEKFERLFVNSFHLPFGSGAIFFYLLVTGLVTYGLFYSHRKGKYLLNLALNSFVVIIIGMSSYGMIIIRSQANTPIDENNPEDPVKLLSYLNREQYGTWPVGYGPYWNSEVIGSEDGNPVYMRGFAVKKGDKLIKGFRTEAEAKNYVAKTQMGGLKIEEEYFVADERKGTEYIYNPEHMTVLPRMFSRDPRHIDDYKSWSGYDGSGPVKVTIENRQTGEVRKEGLPTFANNMQFMVSYQMGWMYWRYFMWNFAGRQNDEQGTDGGPLDGNWISGVSFVDNQLIGDQSEKTEMMKQNKSYNRFFLLPLILGLIGLFWQLYKDPKAWFIIFLLFFFTGMAIIFYLNPKPMEPRERDYAYAGSFYAFAIWIGLGIYALFDMAKRLTKPEIKTFGLSLGGFIAFLYIVEMIKDNGHAFSYTLLYISLIAAVLISLAQLIMNYTKKETYVAYAMVIICLYVPIRMAAEGWDDHDRSNRTAALDLARNYLETCAPNAILFTHGDNDTFPLWYAQEVEGIRRDVRVVNLSLLGTDWYVDQMIRKAYESEPVPFSFTEDLYRQGGVLDQVFIDRSSNKREDLTFSIDSLKNEKNHRTMSGHRFAMMATDKFYIPVDKQAIRDNNVVSEEMMDEVVDTIVFNIGRDYILKNDIMILDLIAHFGWKRPVYFAGQADRDTYLGLSDYLQMEGLNYRFVPVKTENKGGLGRTDTEKMYKNLMEVYRYGNVHADGVLVDYYTRRVTTNYRAQFLNLAQALISEAYNARQKASFYERESRVLADSIKRGGNPLLQTQIDTYTNLVPKNQKIAEEKLAVAKEVIHKCFEVLPEKNIPFDQVERYFVPLLYEAGDSIFGDEILMRLVDIHEANLNYYFSTDIRFSYRMMDAIFYSLSILDDMHQHGTKYGRTALMPKLESVLREYFEEMNGWIKAVQDYDPKNGPKKLQRYLGSGQ
jgi:hypothetical protein